MRGKPFNKEVWMAEDDLVKVSRGDMAELKAMAAGNERKRMRLCAHKEVSDPLHEMFIVHGKDAYVRPHKHLAKSESLQVLEGEADVLIFDEDGGVAQAFRLGEYGSGRRFYYRIGPGQFHCLIVRSEVFVFHECTTGPFDRTGSIFAHWSPDGTDGAAAAEYMRRQGEAARAIMED